MRHARKTTQGGVKFQSKSPFRGGPGDGKRLIGGYLSRVSNRRRSEVRSDDTLDALIVLSEGGRLDPDREARLYETGPAFVQRGRLGFVVIDRAYVPDAFAELVIRAFHLELVEREGLFELYRPTLK